MSVFSGGERNGVASAEHASKNHGSVLYLYAAPPGLALALWQLMNAQSVECPSTQRVGTAMLHS